MQPEPLSIVEKAADYDGLAVAWGIGNKMATAEDCAVACLNHKPGVIQGPYVNLPCNAFAWCPDEICFEPDAHTHHKGDCWLKFTEGPAYPEVCGFWHLQPRVCFHRGRAGQGEMFWGHRPRVCFHRD